MDTDLRDLLFDLLTQVASGTVVMEKSELGGSAIVCSGSWGGMNFYSVQGAIGYTSSRILFDLMVQKVTHLQACRMLERLVDLACTERERAAISGQSGEKLAEGYIKLPARS